jgi:hypothetical protein
MRDTNLRDCPVRMRRMKVIGDFMITGDKRTVIRNVPKVKNGVIGFFVKAGERLTDSSMNTKYRGEGTWVGMVNDVVTRLEIIDSQVKRIVVRSLMDSATLSLRLSTLIKELRLVPLPETILSDTLYYLNPHGHITVSPIAMKDCICMELDSSLEIPDLDELEAKDWEIKIDATTVKVIYNEPIDDDRNRQITIISETFMGRDWAPELTPSDLAWSKSKSFPNYCKGESCSMYDIFEDIKINPDSKHMSSIISRMDIDEFVIANYSLASLKKCFSDLVYRREATKTQQLERLLKKEQDEREALVDLDFDEDDLLDLQDFADGEFGNQGDDIYIDTLEKNFRREEESEEDILDDEDEHDQDEDMGTKVEETFEDGNWEVSKEKLESIAYLLYEDTSAGEEEELSFFESQRQMPSENMFWSDVLEVVKAEQGGERILSSFCQTGEVASDLSLISHAAFFVSLMAGKNLFSDYVKLLSPEVEKSVSMSSRDPVVSEQDSSAHIVSLHQKISDLENTIPTVDGYVQNLLIKKKEELIVQLESYEERDRIYQPVEISYYEYMSCLLEVLKKEGIYDKSDQSSDLEIQSTMLIGFVLESAIARNKYKQVSDSDLSVMRTRIWDRVFSSSFNRFISIGLSCTVEVKKNGERVCIYMPRGSDLEVIVEL